MFFCIFAQNFLLLSSLQLSVLTFPELVSTKAHVDQGEIYDAAFSETTVSAPSKHFIIMEIIIEVVGRCDDRESSRL